MSKKIILTLVVSFLLFFYFEKIYAEIVINEIEINPTEERFIELYNSGEETIDLTGWYLQRKTATGSTFSSLVSKTYFEGKTIEANSYFVISRSSFSNSNIVLGTLTLTESNTIQIKKSEEEVADKVGWGSSTECAGTCPANPAEGQSIQKVGSSWMAGSPTRGAPNMTAPSSLSGGSLSPDTIAAVQGANESKMQKIKAALTAKNITFAGLPLNFKAIASGHNGENLFYGKFFINFGDGDSVEIKVPDAENFSHIYSYPGDYNVSLEYFLNPYGVAPDASHQLSVKVIKPDIVISAVGDESDFFVELTNDTDHEADISNWILGSAGTNFTFPRNTVIGSKRKMTISSGLTRFSVKDKETLKLMTPQWKTIYDLSVASMPQNEITEPVAGVKDAQREENTYQIEEATPLENILGSAIESDVLEENSFGPYVSTISALMFVGVSAGAVYFIRRKKNVLPGSDFKILDE